jgi:RNA polymerase-binding transcription factor DksA
MLIAEWVFELMEKLREDLRKESHALTKCSHGDYRSLCSECSDLR